MGIVLSLSRLLPSFGKKTSFVPSTKCDDLSSIEVIHVEDQASDQKHSITLPMSRTEALSSIRGKTALIPDIKQQFPAWPDAVNVHCEQLRKDINGWIDEYVLTSPLPIQIKF